MANLRTRRSWSSERGFTLPEVMMTTALVGILVAIAIPTWQGIVDGRTLDSAANQLASDLRLAHTRSTNQLTDWQVRVFLGREDQSSGPDYTVVRTSDNLTLQRYLPEKGMISDTELGDAPGGGKVLTFRSTGAVESPGGFANADGDGQIRITVGVGGGQSRGITVVPTTSRVKVVL